MKLVKEDLWKRGDYIYIVTTNGTLRNVGSLVMGRGAAKEATIRYPGVDFIAADQIVDNGKRHGRFWKYDFLQFFTDTGQPFGIFQVKYFWGDNARLDLIKDAAARMAEIAAFGGHYRMNFPGIGNGGLMWNDVIGLLEPIPDNVTICYR